MLFTELENKLRLSCMRALLDNVTPSLRSVSAEIKNKTIYFKATFDQNASEYDYELLSVVSTEIIADFGDFELEETLEIIPFPEKIVPCKHSVYARHERAL